MSDLIIGYYLISGVLFLFFVGSGSIIYDMAWNKEKQIFIRKPKTETKQQKQLEKQQLLIDETEKIRKFELEKIKLEETINLKKEDLRKLNFSIPANKLLAYLYLNFLNIYIPLKN